ncbi:MULTISPECIES: hypothetical protein [unclassified Paenibacillus]|uniref:hypothetical protein n=1 Tax=unclassified Paenibacillus TaxID=185978 RepID=UPI0015C2F10D|nr:hypothetical protein [Paenibacillus sp. FSL H8-0259]
MSITASLAAAAAQGANDTATTFSDMIKSSVTDNFVSDIRISKILITPRCR